MEEAAGGGAGKVTCSVTCLVTWSMLALYFFLATELYSPPPSQLGVDGIVLLIAKNCQMSGAGTFQPGGAKALGLYCILFSVESPLSPEKHSW